MGVTGNSSERHDDEPIDFALPKGYGAKAMLSPDDLQAIGTLIDEKLEKQKNEIITAVAEHFADTVLPLLEKHDKRLEHLEQHTAHPPGAPANA